MRIDRIRGKFLLAILEPDAPLDFLICRKITDLCRTRRITSVSLVYPLRRLDEVMPFMSEVTTITGTPVRSFTHDEKEPTIQ